MIYLGIDPGTNGGVAVVCDVGGGLAVETHPMPEQPGDLVELLRSYGTIAYAVCEKVGPNRGTGDRRQGASSMFTFGRGFGRIEASLVACGVPHEFYPPQVWQAAMGVRRTDKAESDTAKKNRHKAAAGRLFPGVKITHAVADALLICEFARRTHRGHLRRSAP